MKRNDERTKIIKESVLIFTIRHGIVTGIMDGTLIRDVGLQQWKQVFSSSIQSLWRCVLFFFFFLKWRRKNYVSFSIVLYLHAGLAPEVNVGRIFTFVIVPPTFFFIFKDGQVQYFFWCHPQNFVPGHCIFRRKRSKSKRHFNVIQSRRPFQKAFSYRRHIQERKEKNGDKNRHFPRVECLAFFSCFRSTPKFFSISIPRI